MKKGFALGLCLVLVFSYSILFANEKKAQIGPYEILCSDIFQALKKTDGNVTSKKAQKEMLDAFINRALLAIEAEKEGFLNKPDVKHALKIQRMEILSQYYVQKKFSPGNIKLTKNEIENFYKKNIEEINPRKREIISVDLYIFDVSKLKKEDVDNIAKEVSGILNRYKNKSFEALTNVRSKYKNRAMQISMATSSIILSNRILYKGTDYVKKVFSTPVGSSFIIWLSQHDCRVVHVYKDDGRIYDKNFALKAAEKRLRLEKSKELLEKEILRLKKKIGVNLINSECKIENVSK